MITSVAAAVVCLFSFQSDRIGDSFDAWFKDFRKGRAMWDIGVLRPVVRRGSKADAERLLDVLSCRWKREEHTATGRAIQERLVGELAEAERSLAIQAAMLAFLRDGATRVASLEGVAWNHGKPALAARLIPLLGKWHPHRFRPIFESFARGSDRTTMLPALETLVATFSASSYRIVSSALDQLPDLADVRHVVRMLVVLGRQPKVSGRDKDVVLTMVLRKLGDPSVDERLKDALLGLLLEIRAKRSVPVLLGELERVHRKLNNKQASPTGLSFYFYAVHEALAELTGFWAPASSPDRWWAFWEKEKDGFRVRPKKKASTHDKTVAKGFFGIPVRGRRVLFVVDFSGSMGATYREHTRLDEAKKQLEIAVRGLDPEAEFNVVLFSDEAKKLSRRFGPATKSRLRALRKMLAKIAPYGGTNLTDALRGGMAGKIRAMQSPQRKSIDEVFVLSDGAPRSDPKKILAAVARWNVGRVARIHAVYIGHGDDTRSGIGRIPHGRSLGPVSFMRLLAQQNGGVFLVPK